MNKFSKITGLLAVATATIGTVLLLSTPANAHSTLRETCQGSSKLKVENCCAAWVAKNRRPFLWFASSKSCGATVVCFSGSAKSKTLASAIVIPPKKVIDCKIEASTDHFEGGDYSSSNPPPPPPPTQTPPPADPEVPR